MRFVGNNLQKGRYPTDEIHKDTPPPIRTQPAGASEQCRRNLAQTVLGQRPGRSQRRLIRPRF